MRAPGAVAPDLNKPLDLDDFTELVAAINDFRLGVARLPST